MNDSRRKKENELVEAVMSSNHDEVERLLFKEKLDPNVNFDRYDGSLLHLAVSSKNATTVEHLLDAGVNIYAYDGDGRTALDLAITFKRNKIADLLLDFEKNGSKRQQNTSNEQSNLSGVFNVEGAKSLADLRRVDVEGNTGFTKLACEGRFDEVIKIAIKDKKDAVTIADLTYTNHMAMDVLTILGFDKTLHQVFTLELWEGRSEECRKLWDILPEPLRKSVDFEKMNNLLNVSHLHAAGSKKRPRRRPTDPKSSK